MECAAKRATASMLRLAFTAPEDTDGDGLEDTEGGDGRHVVVRTDPIQATNDRYRRLLTYVTTLAGKNLAIQQLAKGWANVDIVGRAFSELSRFLSAKKRARSSRRGAWSVCGGNFHSRQ